MNLIRWFLIPIVFAGCAAAQPASSSRPMTMEVTIVATGKDSAPVEDLKQDDITIRDNGKKQEIVAFEKVTAGVAPIVQGKPSLYNIVLLDALNTTYSDLPNVREEMVKMLGELKGADNLVVLMLRNGLRLVHDYSGTPNLLTRFAAQTDTSPDAYSWVFKDELGLNQLFTPAGIFDQRRIEDSLGALQTIAKNYQGRSGRKNLYWISSGFPIVMGSTPAGYDELALGGGNTPSARDKSTTAGTKANEDLTRFAKDLDTTARMLNNANVAIYPIDSRALSVDNMKVSEKSTMMDLAHETGGIAYTSRKDVAAAMGEALRDTRVVYVVKYAISELKFDGEFHQVKVETKRKDVKFRARNGYFAPVTSRK
jgi:VWFA-related protein